MQAQILPQTSQMNQTLVAPSASEQEEAEKSSLSFQSERMMLAISPANVLITTWFPKILAQAISKIYFNILCFFRILRCIKVLVIGYNAWTGLPGTRLPQPAVHSFDSSWGGRVHRAASVLMAWVEQAEAEIFEGRILKQVIVSSRESSRHRDRTQVSWGQVCSPYSMAIRQQPTMSATTHSFPISFTDPCSKLHNHMVLNSVYVMK